VVRRLVALPWDGARFLAPPGIEGAAARLDAELTGTDVVVMIATSGASAAAASAIGDACASHGVMTVGLVVSGANPAEHVLAALRPNAMVLVVLREESDVPGILSALRA
jgi:hypothetical protein